MSHSHHEHEDSKAVADSERALKQRRVLGAVMYINGAMAVIEGACGIAARSTALFTDMLEMAGDSAAAALGRMGVNRSKRWQAWASLAKAAGMMALGLGAAGWVVFRMFNPVMPVVHLMTAIGGLAFTANATCAGLLYKYRNDNLNLKSSFKCVRNDMVANLGVIGAGLASKYLTSSWPDVIVAAGVSALFIKSSAGLIREAIAEIRSPTGKNLDHCGHSHAHKSLSPWLALHFKRVLGGSFNKKAKKDVSQPPHKHGPADNLKP